MNLSDLSIRDFSLRLAAKESVPGGGGAAAAVGALGAALNCMVGNFSIGKKKFLGMEKEHQALIDRGNELRENLICLIDKDAENFEPLSKAYGIAAQTEQEKAEKDIILQGCLKKAAEAPIEMMGCIYEAILLHSKMVDMSTKIMISDIGVGVCCLKAALQSAYLNVAVNLNLITDEKYVSAVKADMDEKLKKGMALSDEVYKKVLNIMA